MAQAARSGHVIGIPVSSNGAFAPDEASVSVSSGSCKSRTADNLVRGIKEHVSLGPNLSETFKGKLSLGKRIIQAGGVDRVFRQSFTPEKGEMLIRASQCYLSTSAGPIAGLLFVSSGRIAFRSDRSVAVTAFDGGVVRVPYKVSVPLGKVSTAKPSANRERPEEKYVRVATVDGFEFWFMGFVSFQKSFRCVQDAIAAVH